MSRKKRIKAALKALGLKKLPAGATPVDAVLLIQWRDEDGYPRWSYRDTDNGGMRLSNEVLLGVFASQADLFSECLKDAWNQAAE